MDQHVTLRAVTLDDESSWRRITCEDETYSAMSRQSNDKDMPFECVLLDANQNTTGDATQDWVTEAITWHEAEAVETPDERLRIRAGSGSRAAKNRVVGFCQRCPVFGQYAGGKDWKVRSLARRLELAGVCMFSKPQNPSDAAVLLTGTPRARKVVLVGWGLARAVRGRGLATAAALVLLQRLKELGAEVAVALITASNTKSCALAVRLGFQQYKAVICPRTYLDTCRARVYALEL